MSKKHKNLQDSKDTTASPIQSDAFAQMFKLGLKVAQAGEHLSAVAAQDVEIATTPKELIFEYDKVRLYRYTPLRKGGPVTGPMLMCYGLIGRYTMADLQQDRSLVRNLLCEGVDLYVVDWGTPTRADKFLTLDDYIADYLGSCVDVILETSGAKKVSLLGICEGGVFTACYAALNPQKINALVLTITPLDFAGDKNDFKPTDGFLNIWIQSLEREDVESLIDIYGNLPGNVMGSVFSAMTPVRSLTKYNLDLINIAEDEDQLLNFLRMEKWLADRPAHPGVAAKQWLNDLYRDNKLVKNTFEVGGEKVNLTKITMPVLNIFAQNDHIIPASCTAVLGPLIGTKDYTEMELPGGHIGVFVGSRSNGVVGKGIFEWMQQRYI